VRKCKVVRLPTSGRFSKMFFIFLDTVDPKKTIRSGVQDHSLRRPGSSTWLFYLIARTDYTIVSIPQNLPSNSRSFGVGSGMGSNTEALIAELA